MIDLKTISEMDVNKWSSFVATLSAEDIAININILNMAHGFILCKELIKYNLPEEVINKIFYTSLLNNSINSLEGIYKKS